MANELPLLNPLLQSNMDAAGFQITGLGGAVLSAGDITLFQDPTNALHAVTKQYADLLGAGSTLTAGRGIVKGAGPTYAINFAQDLDYTANEIPFATSTTAMGFSSDLSWDDAGKVLTVNGEMETITGIQFDTSSPASSALGKLIWNDTDMTLEVQVSSSGVVLQIGQEDHIFATNDTGSAITNGTPVALVGATLGRPTIEEADNTPHSFAEKTVGVATELIGAGSEGFVTVRGFVRDLNTNAWNEGDILYVSGTGTISNVAPSPPLTTVVIGYVVVKSATVGVIYVKPEVYHEFGELTDVDDSSKVAGSMLYWDSGSSTFLLDDQITFDGDVLTINGGATRFPTTAPLGVDIRGSGTITAGEYGGALIVDTEWVPSSPVATAYAASAAIYSTWEGTAALTGNGGVFGVYSVLGIEPTASAATSNAASGSFIAVHAGGSNQVGNLYCLSTAGSIGAGSTVTGDFAELNLSGYANAGTISGTGYHILQAGTAGENLFNADSYFSSDVILDGSVGNGFVSLLSGTGEVRWFDIPNYLHRIVQSGNNLIWYRPSGAPGATVPSLYSVGGGTGGFYTAARFGIFTGAVPTFAGLEVNGDIRQTSGGVHQAWINLVEGAVYVDTASDTTTISLTTTWYLITSTGWADGGSNGVTVNTSTGTLTPTVAGTYDVFWSLSFSGGNSTTYRIGVCKNGTGGVQAMGKAERKLGVGGDVGNANGHCRVSMNGTTDYLNLGIYNVDNTNDITTVHLQLTAIRVGE